MQIAAVGRFNAHRSRLTIMQGTPQDTRQKISTYNLKKIKDPRNRQKFQSGQVLFSLIVGHRVSHNLLIVLILFMLFPFGQEVFPQ